MEALAQITDVPVVASSSPAAMARFPGVLISYSEQTGTANPFNGDGDLDLDLDLVVGEQDGILNFFLNVDCLLPGTLVATPTGERPIAELPLPRIKFSRQLPSGLRRQLSSAALVV